MARCTRPMTPLRRRLASISFVIALLAAVISGHDARALGADWRKTSVAALGGYVLVAIAYHLGGRLAGPRRFRV
ncbi:hypothetical protein ABZV31_37565 [Streptomyces sp. NPDC005202]|uniref:hypothetical protein n=1 Tax=Streptomyces sp. NPDC005202 TaxID=3157021 RepID=UPI0033A7DA50